MLVLGEVDADWTPDGKEDAAVGGVGREVDDLLEIGFAGVVLLIPKEILEVIARPGLPRIKHEVIQFAVPAPVLVGVQGGSAEVEDPPVRTECDIGPRVSDLDLHDDGLIRGDKPPTPELDGVAKAGRTPHHRAGEALDRVAPNTSREQDEGNDRDRDDEQERRREDSEQRTAAFVSLRRLSLDDLFAVAEPEAQCSLDLQRHRCVAEQRDEQSEEEPDEEHAARDDRSEHQEDRDQEHLKVVTRGPSFEGFDHGKDCHELGKDLDLGAYFEHTERGIEDGDECADRHEPLRGQGF